MTKIRKQKRKKTYKVDVNRKRLRNRMRKVPTINCPQIKQAWDMNKSTKTNLHQMGLAYDPNQALKVPNLKTTLMKTAKRKAHGELVSSDEDVPKKRVPKKIQVVKDLEAEARAPRQRMFKLPKGQVLFLTYLLQKYGEDYEAMARDKKNHYQLTWRQIRQKINTFKNIPEQYAEYLVQSGEIVLEDPTPLEETKKRIAEENLRKHSAPKKPKKQKPVLGQWIEEDIEEETDNFDTEKTLDDDERKDSISDISNGVDESEKKLKLFSDEEDEVEESDAKGLNNEKLKDVKNAKRKDIQKKRLAKAESSDSEDSEELEGDDDDEVGFKNLEDMSDEELSDDDILDDGEFVTDSDESD